MGVTLIFTIGNVAYRIAKMCRTKSSCSGQDFNHAEIFVAKTSRIYLYWTFASPDLQKVLQEFSEGFNHKASYSEPPTKVMENVDMDCVSAVFILSPLLRGERYKF